MASISVPNNIIVDKLPRTDRKNSVSQSGRYRRRCFYGRNHCRLSSIILCAVSEDTAKDVAEFPPFLPPEVKNVKDPAARQMARRIQRLPVQTNLSKQPIMSSCVMPKTQNMDATPAVFLHGFDSSCLEWRYAYPLIEAAGVESWAVDLLGWGFTTGEGVTSFSVAAKREHLYEFWRTYIQRPMVLVGASLGAAAAIDFAVLYPESVSSLVLIDASVYAEGTGNMAKFPKFLAYAGVSLLKSTPLRSYANLLAFHSISTARIIDSMNVGRLHCLLPHWEEATIDFMRSGGYKVATRVKEVQKKTLVIWGENDKIVSKEYAQRLQNDIQESKLRYISECGHIPHVEKPDIVATIIIEFLKGKHANCLENET